MTGEDLGRLFPDAGSLFPAEPVETPEELDADAEAAEEHDGRFADGPDDGDADDSNFGQNTTE